MASRFYPARRLRHRSALGHGDVRRHLRHQILRYVLDTISWTITRHTLIRKYSHGDEQNNQRQRDYRPDCPFRESQRQLIVSKSIGSARRCGFQCTRSNSGSEPTDSVVWSTDSFEGGARSVRIQKNMAVGSRSTWGSEHFARFFSSVADNLPAHSVGRASVATQTLSLRRQKSEWQFRVVCSRSPTARSHSTQLSGASTMRVERAQTR